jgi:hypothetical protein
MKAQEKGGSAWNWLFLAMAHHRLAHTDEANKWLGKAAEWIEQANQKKRHDPDDFSWDDVHHSWQDRLELQILRREAEALIKGQAER